MGVQFALSGEIGGPETGDRDVHGMGSEKSRLDVCYYYTIWPKLQGQS